jgi:hypothetical protein
MGGAIHNITIADPHDEGEFTPPLAVESTTLSANGIPHSGKKQRPYSRDNCITAFYQYDTKMQKNT